MAIDFQKQLTLGALTGAGSILYEGRASVDIAKGDYEKTEERTDKTSWSGSEVLTTGDLNIKSGKDITLGASELQAKGDINLDAAGNVKIETRDEVITETKKETKGEVTVSVGISNAIVDAGIAAKELKDATDALNKAERDYNSFKNALDKAEEAYNDGLITQEEYLSIKGDEKYYRNNVYLQRENVAAKTLALANTTGSAAKSIGSGALGFRGDISIDIDGKKTETNTETVNALGSAVLSGGNINIKSGETAKIEGSIVNAAEDVTIDAKNVEILAGKSTFESSTSEKEFHGTARVDTSLTYSANLSGSKTESDTTGEYYTNSYVGGTNVTIKSKEDTIVKGGNVEADEKLKMDVGGNLVVESVQDKVRSDSYTIGANIGGSSGGGDAKSAKVGGNFNISKSEKDWVNEQTSLTGGSVEIYVENKTTLKGAVIAADNGDLKLDTGSLEYSHINDKDRSYSIGGGVSLGGSQSPDKYGDAVSSPTYSVDGNYSLRDKRQKNFATVGEGEIIVRDGGADLSGLNRDVDKAQYETKEETGLEGSFRLDDTTIDMARTLAWGVNNPLKAVDEIVDLGAKSWEGLKEFGGDVVDVGKDILDAAEKAKDFFFSDENEPSVEVAKGKTEEGKAEPEVKENKKEEAKKILKEKIDDIIKNGTEDEKKLFSVYKDNIIGFDGDIIILGNPETGEPIGMVMTNPIWHNQRESGLEEYGIKGSSMCNLNGLVILFENSGFDIPGEDSNEANRLLRLVVEKGGKKPSDIYDDQLRVYEILTGIITKSEKNIVIQHVARGDKWDDASTKALLDQGIPVAVGSKTTGAGHILVLVGYDEYGWIVHDSYADRNSKYKDQNGAFVRYKFGEFNINKSWRAYIKINK